MSNAAESLLWSLDQARRQTVALCAGIHDDQLTAQPPGAPNHPAWTLGHLFLLDAYIADLLTPEESPRLDQRWADAYGPASVPRAENPDNQTRADYLARLDTVRAAVIGAVAGLDDDGLCAPLPDASRRDEFPTVAHLLQYALWHEAFHAGQLSAWRKAMGLASVPVAFGVMPGVSATGA